VPPFCLTFFFSYKISIIYALKIEHVNHDLLWNDNLYECSVHTDVSIQYTRSAGPRRVYNIQTLRPAAARIINNKLQQWCVYSGVLQHTSSELLMSGCSLLALLVIRKGCTASNKSYRPAESPFVFAYTI